MACHGTHYQANLDTAIPNALAKTNLGVLLVASWHCKKGALLNPGSKKSVFHEALYTFLNPFLSVVLALICCSNARSSSLFAVKQLVF